MNDNVEIEKMIADLKLIIKRAQKLIKDLEKRATDD